MPSGTPATTLMRKTFWTFFTSTAAFTRVKKPRNHMGVVQPSAKYRDIRKIARRGDRWIHHRPTPMDCPASPAGSPRIRAGRRGRHDESVRERSGDGSGPNSLILPDLSQSFGKRVSHWTP